jgi:bromodomain-containing factor 1
MTDDSHTTNGATTNGDIHIPNGVVETPADSPPTPVSSNITSDAKFDIDFQQESDARHEPLPIKNIDKIDRLDALPASPVDQGALYFHTRYSFILITESEDISATPPNRTPTPTPPAEDIRMEDVPKEDAPKEEDIAMGAPTPSPSTMEVDTANGTTDSEPSTQSIEPSVATEPSASFTTPNDYPSQPDDDSHGPPPAKRARKHSDADQASLAHVSVLSFVRRYGRADVLLCRPSKVRHSPSSFSVYLCLV